MSMDRQQTFGFEVNVEWNFEELEPIMVVLTRQSAEPQRIFNGVASIAAPQNPWELGSRRNASLPKFLEVWAIVGGQYEV